MISAELKVIRDMPHKYGKIARKVDLAMILSSRPCVGYGCDLDSSCDRHKRIPEVIERYLRVKALQA